ncbi:hypothetical protein E2C01_001071 [Portunus trituberculatus]|uniref:Uncharacterized protein n=1 Tax=Portunus trituberculatus TaxID=210409 RepID=A0A5B7CIF5_PORTR|nr:hypothetical protein [Portunus trituberculatus]
MLLRHLRFNDVLSVTQQQQLHILKPSKAYVHSTVKTNFPHSNQQSKIFCHALPALLHHLPVLSLPIQVLLVPLQGTLQVQPLLLSVFVLILSEQHLHAPHVRQVQPLGLQKLVVGPPPVIWERNLSTSSVRAVFWVFRMAVYSSRSALDAFSASSVLHMPLSWHRSVH